MHGRRSIYAELSGDPAPFNAAIFETVRDIIPAARLNVHLESLISQMSALQRDGAANPLILGEQAHKIISQAGMLGLMRLSRRACMLEDACNAGEGVAEALRACCAAAGDIERYALVAAKDPSTSG